MRVFLETNALVSAFACRGIRADLFELVLLDHELISGRNVLRAPAAALRSKIRLAKAHADAIVEFVAAEAAFHSEHAEPEDADADADDALVRAEALGGRSGVFVSGDAALLRLGALGAMRVLSPRQFREALHESR